MQRYIYIIGIAILGLISCQKEDLTSTPSVDYGEAVAVKLNFTVDGTEPGTEEAQTKAMTKANNGSTDNDLAITVANNIWIIQFDGTDDDSEAIVAHYLSGDITEATLLPLGRATTIVAVANTFNPNLVPMPLRMTLLEFKELHRDIVANTDGNGAFYGGGVLSTGDDGKTYFILNDYCNATVSASGNVESEDEETSSLNFFFKRNVAKVIINLENKWEGAQINSITMNEVATESHFYTNRDITAVFPSASVATMDYNNSDIEISYGGSQSFVYYVPVNMQGEDNTITGAESDKPFHAPSCATYASILVSETGPDNSATEYRIYLGANLTTDYNLEANKEYEYTITFNGKGDVDNDYRIKEIGVVDYTERESANCYIINPSEDVARIYYIPIEDRINEFWREYTITGLDIIDSSTEWEIYPLWCDDTTYDITLEKAVRNKLHAIKVTIPKASTAYSNVIVAVRIDGKIVWSWHLWITDYDPDSRAYSVDENIFTYPVDGGYIERYQDDTESDDINITGNVWGAGGIYENMFMMDRNLGSRSSDRLGQGGGPNKAAGTLYYQFGRKDPFPADYGFTISEPGDFDPQYNTVSESQNFAYSVENPLVFITSSANWCLEQAAYNFSYLWNDYNCNNPAVGSDGYLTKIVENTGRRKSIFDPSPLGWRLPIRAAWNGFNTSTFTANTYAVDYQENDRTYNLTGTLYVANNRRYGESGNYGTTQSGYIWSASPNPYQDASGARCLQFDKESVDNYSFLSRANAFNVRCVKDNIDYE